MYVTGYCTFDHKPAHPVFKNTQISYSGKRLSTFVSHIQDIQRCVNIFQGVSSKTRPDIK